MDRWTVVIADDSELYRHILVRLLKAVPELEVVGEAADGLEAVEICAIRRPDLVVLDFHMPYLDGLQAGERIAKVSPGTVLALLTATLESRLEKEAARLGFRATIAKQLGSTSIRAALTQALGAGAGPVVHRATAGAHRSGTRLTEAPADRRDRATT